MHFFLIQGLVESFNHIPLGNVVVHPAMYHTMVQFFTDYFIIAFKISSPVFVAILIVNVVLGILARTAPQMNMFVIGMPLKVYVGLMILVLTVFLIPAIADFILNQTIYIMDQLIRGMAP
jgi:flagellar biosynthetic protein FliR